MDATIETPVMETPETTETEDQGETVERIAPEGQDTEESESAEDSEESGEEQKPIYKKKLKIDGEEREIVVKTDADMDRLIQKGIAADKNFQAAAEARKEVAATKKEFGELVERWQENILNVFDDLGIDPIEFSKKVVNAIESYEGLTPEQRRIMELEQGEARRQIEDEKRNRTAEEQAKAIEQQEIMKEYETIVQQMKTGLASAKLPTDNKSLARVASYMQANKNATVEEAIEMYRIENEYRNRTSKKPAEKEKPDNYGEITNKPKERKESRQVKDSDVQEMIRQSFHDAYAGK